MIVPSWSALTWAGLPVSNWLGVSPSSADAWHVANARTATTMPAMGMAAIARGRMQFQKCSLVVLHLVYFGVFMIFLSFLIVPGGMTCPRVFVSLVLAGCRSAVDSG